MKKIVFINSVIGNGSTGKICVDLAKKYEDDGYDVKIAYGRNECSDDYKKYAIKIGTKLDVYFHVLMTRLFDLHGFCSKRATRKFLKWLDTYNPDIIWLHNLHGYYINIELLFEWIKMHPNIEVKWTLHDCWAFTGHCSYYMYNKCDKWLNENELHCTDCSFVNSYPKCVFLSNTNNNYKRKKQAFTGVNNMVLVTPSEWLKNEVKHSFLNEYDVDIIRNEIDRNIFKPTPSNLRNELHLENKKIILAVANVWNKQKGLYDIYKLDKMIDDSYRIIVIGLNDKQMHYMQNMDETKIIPIKRTANQVELAKYYTMADVFINPTHEDNYPTVNLEAEACGTRVITYDVGGCKETIHANSIYIKPSVDEILCHL